MSVRLLYLVSHPIQYQAPLLRRIAADDDIELRVLFEDLETAGRYHDSGFGRDVAWDTPLLEGYDHGQADGLNDVADALEVADVLWVHGWDSRLKRRALGLAGVKDLPVLMRGENTRAAMPDGAFLRGVLKRRYLDWIFSRCAGFLCIGSDNRCYYEAHGVGADRLFSMPYAVDNEFFRDGVANAGEAEARIRDELGIPERAAVILFAGKLQARKHPETLLRAFAAIAGEIGGGAVLVFVGDGEERARLEAEAASSGAAVRFAGFRNQRELPAFYRMADVFVLVAEREPWGLAINEAMNGACAIIASDQCGAAADLVSDDCGRVVRPGDEGALAAVLAELLADRERLQAMGRAASERVSRWGLAESQAGLKEALAAVVGKRKGA